MFEIRKIKKDKWLIILLVGLLLVVIAMPVSDIKSDQTQDEQQVQKAEMHQRILIQMHWKHGGKCTCKSRRSWKCKGDDHSGFFLGKGSGKGSGDDK